MPPGVFLVGECAAATMFAGGVAGQMTAGLHRDGEGSFARCARAN